jgi:IS30 family transposase
VIEGILGDKSPEQVAERVRTLWQEFGISGRISHETIYSFIYSDSEAKEKKLYNHLRRHRKNRRKQWERRPREKILIKERTSIHERPEYVNKRKEFWHFETDSVIFSQWRPILSVQYERCTSLARLTKLPDKSAPETANALRSLVYEFDGLHPVRSVTYDNGGENVLHTELIHEYWVVTYFTDTYSSWQKWGVENLNGLIRQYLPRHIDLESLSDEDIYVIQEKLNNRPRKRLKWLTPNEYYAKITWQDCTIRKLFP